MIVGRTIQTHGPRSTTTGLCRTGDAGRGPRGLRHCRSGERSVPAVLTGSSPAAARSRLGARSNAAIATRDRATRSCQADVYSLVDKFLRTIPSNRGIRARLSCRLMYRWLAMRYPSVVNLVMGPTCLRIGNEDRLATPADVSNPNRPETVPRYAPASPPTLIALVIFVMRLDAIFTLPFSCEIVNSANA